MLPRFFLFGAGVLGRIVPPAGDKLEYLLDAMAGQQLSAIYTKDLSLVVIPQDYNTNVLSEVPSVEGTEASGTEEDAEGNAAGEPGQEGTPQE